MLTPACGGEAHEVRVVGRIQRWRLAIRLAGGPARRRVDGHHDLRARRRGLRDCAVVVAQQAVAVRRGLDVVPRHRQSHPLRAELLDVGDRPVAVDVADGPGQVRLHALLGGVRDGREKHGGSEASEQADSLATRPSTCPVGGHRVDVPSVPIVGHVKTTTPVVHPSSAGLPHWPRATDPHPRLDGLDRRPGARRRRAQRRARGRRPRRAVVVGDALVEQAKHLRRGADRARGRGRRGARRARRGPTGRCSPGAEGLVELITDTRCDLVLNALVGSAGLGPTIASLGEGIDLALANKESLVVGGELVMALAEATGAQVIPVDSEHSALYPADRRRAARDRRQARPDGVGRARSGAAAPTTCGRSRARTRSPIRPGTWAARSRSTRRR